MGSNCSYGLKRSVIIYNISCNTLWHSCLEWQHQHTQAIDGTSHRCRISSKCLRWTEAAIVSLQHQILAVGAGHHIHNICQSTALADQGHAVSTCEPRQCGRQLRNISQIQTSASLIGCIFHHITIVSHISTTQGSSVTIAVVKINITKCNSEMRL